LDRLSQNEIIFFPVGRRFAENDVEDNPFGPCLYAKLDERRIDLPWPGPLDSFFAQSGQALLVYFEHQDLRILKGRMESLKEVHGFELVGFEEVELLKGNDQEHSDERK
jgi:hypothetical protein